MKTIICYGDSNTWGFSPETQTRYSREIRWTAQLQKSLGNDYYVIEEGLNGRTTCYDDPIFPQRNGVKGIFSCMETNYPADLVIIMLGTNDSKKHLNATAFASAKGVEMIAKIITQGEYGINGMPPEMLIVAPISIGNTITEVWTGSEFDKRSVVMIDQLRDELRKMAKLNGYHFMDAGLIAEPDSLDSIHLNTYNHTLFAQAVKNKVLQILSKTKE